MAVRRIVSGQPVVTQHVVDTPQEVVTTDEVVAPTQVVAQPQVVESRRVVRRSWARFSVSQIVHGACALFLLILGGVTVGRAGFGDGIGTHTVEVLGITTTAMIGLVELFLGLLLLCAALAPEGRGFGGFIGVLLFVGGIIVAAGSDNMLNDLHTEGALGWIGIIVGAVSMLAAVLPTFLVDRRSTAVDVW
jgi:putative copper export protein